MFSLYKHDSLSRGFLWQSRPVSGRVTGQAWWRGVAPFDLKGQVYLRLAGRAVCVVRGTEQQSLYLSPGRKRVQRCRRLVNRLPIPRPVGQLTGRP